MIDFHIISVLVLSNHNRSSDSRSALTIVLDKFSINFIITQPVDFFLNAIFLKILFKLLKLPKVHQYQDDTCILVVS